MWLQKRWGGKIYFAIRFSLFENIISLNFGSFDDYSVLTVTDGCLLSMSPAVTLRFSYM